MSVTAAQTLIYTQSSYNHTNQEERDGRKSYAHVSRSITDGENGETRIRLNPAAMLRHIRSSIDQDMLIFPWNPGI